VPEVCDVLGGCVVPEVCDVLGGCVVPEVCDVLGGCVVPEVCGTGIGAGGTGRDMGAEAVGAGERTVDAATGVFAFFFGACD
jgi:hypothetical protein